MRKNWILLIALLLAPPAVRAFVVDSALSDVRASPGPYYVGMPIIFSNSMANEFQSEGWDFKDGCHTNGYNDPLGTHSCEVSDSLCVKAAARVTHTFSAPGDYNVQHYAQSMNCNESGSTILIHVQPAPLQPAPSQSLIPVLMMILD